VFSNGHSGKADSRLWCFHEGRSGSFARRGRQPPRAPLRRTHSRTVSGCVCPGEQPLRLRAVLGRAGRHAPLPRRRGPAGGRREARRHISQPTVPKREYGSRARPPPSRCKARRTGGPRENEARLRMYFFYYLYQSLTERDSLGCGLNVRVKPARLAQRGRRRPRQGPSHATTALHLANPGPGDRAGGVVRRLLRYESRPYQPRHGLHRHPKYFSYLLS
jgi:hypothetical protein